MKETSVKPISKRYLSGLFFIALAVFIFIRWDSSVWLSGHIDQAAAGAGYQITYDHVSVSGLGINFEHLQVNKQGQQPIALTELNVSLSFSSLLSGELGADIDALWLGNPISLTAASAENLLHMTNIDAMLDISRVENLKIPAKLSGLLAIQGDITIDQNTGQPQSGNLHTTWNQAMAGLAQPEFTLGDYQVQINSVEDSALPWQWIIAGGNGVGLDGSGTVAPQNPDPKQWQIDGNVSLNVDNSNPSLAMMVQTMLGSNQAKIRLSGTLGNPRTDIIR